MRFLSLQLVFHKILDFPGLDLYPAHFFFTFRTQFYRLVNCYCILNYKNEKDILFSFNCFSYHRLQTKPGNWPQTIEPCIGAGITIHG